MARIAIVTSGHFCSNPRVWREADALASSSHEVTVVGVRIDPIQSLLDDKMLGSRRWRYRAGADIRGGRFGKNLHRHWHRFCAKAGRLGADLGYPNPCALGYAVYGLLSAARDEGADLTIVHLEPAFWVGARLLKEGRRVGADFEDWHSRNSAPGIADARIAGYMASLESCMMRGAAHKTTASAAMARALGQAYAGVEPEVIYNSSRTPPCRVREGDEEVRMVWFSQTLGRGRGLEDLFRALPLLRGNWRLELRANALPEALAWVRQSVPATLMERVKISPTIPPDQLSQAVARNDIGLALEIPDCCNKDLTASNKIFEYLQTGLFVAASDTAGQREVLDKVRCGGELYPSGDSVALAALLNRWIEARARLRALRPQIHAEANAWFAYERQVPRLLASVERALADRTCL